MGDNANFNRAEHVHISYSLEVEKLEEHLFRSKSLWMPARGRGVFGGQVISQALVSATNCIDPVFGLHSLHCYFLTSASPSTPIVYSVEKLRQGRSYVTCAVKAIQKGNLIFMMMCSFQKPEPWQPTHQIKMPVVPTPDECELQEDRFLKIAESLDNPGMRDAWMAYAMERSRSPIEVKVVKEYDESIPGIIRGMYWMRAKNVPQYETPFQKCILSYLSDLNLFGSAIKSLGLQGRGKGRPNDENTVSMTSTIDHSIYFYSNDFDCGDWLLYVTHCPRAGSGRCILHGQLFTRGGVLVAVTSQEGIIRANRRNPKANL